MARETINFSYLKQIKPISEYLEDTPLSEKSIKTYMSALDKIFPMMIKRFGKFEIEEWNNKIREEYKNMKFFGISILEIIFHKFKQVSPEKKADILQKWWKDEAKKWWEKEPKKNTRLNYVWRMQGLLAKLGRSYEANPKRITKLNDIDKVNGIKVDLDITYEEVVELYELLPTKEKLIVKIMMYAGFNGVDILSWKPSDIIKTKDEQKEKTYYFICKRRIKTQGKGAYYFVVFEQDFFNELKNYFEVIEKKDWKKDQNKTIFHITSSKTISDNISNHVRKNNLNRFLNPANIRRMCFSRLEKALIPDRIYDGWTQHKHKNLARREYIAMKNDMISVLPRIKEQVLISSRKEMTNEVKKVKEHNGILEEQNKEIENLKNKMEKLENLIIQLIQKDEIEILKKKQEE